MRHAQTTYETTAKARERYAKELFDLKRVQEAIEQRAAAGFRDLRMIQKHPFDLSRSALVRQVENWLEEHHYRYAWSPTLPATDPQRSSLSEDYPELVIFW